MMLEEASVQAASASFTLALSAHTECFIHEKFLLGRLYRDQFLAVERGDRRWGERFPKNFNIGDRVCTMNHPEIVGTVVGGVNFQTACNAWSRRIEVEWYDCSTVEDPNTLLRIS